VVKDDFFLDDLDFDDLDFDDFNTWSTRVFVLLTISSFKFSLQLTDHTNKSTVAGP
jgi:hypothetical protein